MSVPSEHHAGLRLMDLEQAGQVLPQTSLEPVLEDIKQRLRTLQPYRVILFGSYAWGNPREDSDIDLIVVLNVNRLPRSFAERLDFHHHVRKELRAINYTRPLDLLVYTKAEWRRLVGLGSSFINEIIQRGRVLV